MGIYYQKATGAIYEITSEIVDANGSLNLSSGNFSSNIGDDDGDTGWELQSKTKSKNSNT